MLVLWLLAFLSCVSVRLVASAHADESATAMESCSEAAERESDRTAVGAASQAPHWQSIPDVGAAPELSVESEDSEHDACLEQSAVKLSLDVRPLVCFARRVRRMLSTAVAPQPLPSAPLARGPP